MPRSMTAIDGKRQGNNIMNLSQIVKSVRADITNLKAQLECIPPFPDGKKPPSPLARFSNKVDRINTQLKPQTAPGGMRAHNRTAEPVQTLPEIT